MSNQNECLLRTLHEYTPVSVTDAGDTIIEVNDAFCAISDYARAELVGGGWR
jgi:PAS domain S-box-containing protein